MSLYNDLTTRRRSAPPEVFSPKLTEVFQFYVTESVNTTDKFAYKVTLNVNSRTSLVKGVQSRAFHNRPVGRKLGLKAIYSVNDYLAVTANASVQTTYSPGSIHSFSA